MKNDPEETRSSSSISEAAERWLDAANRWATAEPIAIAETMQDVRFHSFRAEPTEQDEIMLSLVRVESLPWLIEELLNSLPDLVTPAVMEVVVMWVCRQSMPAANAQALMAAIRQIAAEVKSRSPQQ